jgi:RNA polymerase sigma-70 factor (ECF subfamily)
VSGYPELDEVVAGVKARREDAFTTVYHLTAGALTSFAFGMLHDRRAAEDAVQQAFLELVQAAPTLRGDGRSLRAWLFRSVRFTCLDEIRRRSRHPEQLAATLPERAAVDDAVPEGEEVGLDPELEEAMGRLTDRQRSLVVLKHVVGLSGEEIAAIVGGNRAAVYAATARAERRLRSLLPTVESPAAAASSPMTEPRDPEEAGS